MKKIILINILIMLILIMVLEWVSFLIAFNKNINLFENEVKINKIKYYLNHKSCYVPGKEEFEGEMRPIEYRSSQKKPIILLGDSFTHGNRLKDNETFSYKLANYTNKTVINRGICGEGLGEIYRQLTDDEILNRFPSDTEYFIYTFIPDHIERSFRFRNCELSYFYITRYKLHNNKLEFIDSNKNIFSIFNYFYIKALLENYIYLIQIHDTKKTYNLFYKYIEEIYKIIKTKFPNSKFVILYMYDIFDSREDDGKFNINDLKKVKEKNKDIIILDSLELCPQLKENKYWMFDGHPSTQAWDILVPEISKKLELNTNK